MEKLLRILEDDATLTPAEIAVMLEKEEGVYKRLYTLQEEALKSAGIRE